MKGNEVGHLVVTVSACLSLSSAAWAAFEDQTQAVVKISSYMCDRPTRVRHGSGTMLSVEGTRYVITSDHVLFHGDRGENICHAAHDTEHGTRPVELTAANIAVGMALLRVGAENEVQSQFPNAVTLAQVVGFAASGDEARSITTAGFPFASESRLVHRGGEVLNRASRRALVPLVDTFLELQAHTEFGMSGGGVFDHDGHYVGLISHQYLQLAAGSDTSIGDLDETTVPNAQMIGLAIPADHVKSWVNSVLTRETTADLRENLADQLARRDSLTTSGLRFSPLACDGRPAPIRGDAVGGERRGGDGVGIGGERRGGDGVGIGGERRGGDGVGIGGEGSDGGSPCSLQIELDDALPSQAWPLAPAGWLETVRNSLTRRSQVRIVGFVDGTSIYPVPGLIGSLRYLHLGYQPLLEVSGSDIQSLSDVERQLQTALAVAADYQKRLELLSCWQDEATFVAADLQFVQQIAARRQYVLARAEIVDRMVRPQGGTSSAKGWERLYACDLDLAAELRGALLRVATDLNSLRL